MKKKILLLSAFAVISHALYAQVVYGTEENKYVKSMYDNPISHIDNPEEPVVPTIEEPRYQLSGLTDNLVCFRTDRFPLLLRISSHPYRFQR